LAGLYVHIPFCVSKCSYCDFYSTASLGLIDNFIHALSKEICFKSEIQDLRKPETIYFGGGTPSVLTISQIEEILNLLAKNFDINNVKEISFEANPENLSLEYLKGLKSIGVNRISIGIQSLRDDTLKYLRRRHNSRKALESVMNAEKAGFENICADLIYGISNLNSFKWGEDLETVFKLPVKHLSAYHLSVEQNTLLFRQVQKKQYSVTDEEHSREQFFALNNISEKYGFKHYEISNLALSGYQSLHNSAYWDEKPYLGFGPSAHSYYANTRTWNVGKLNEYISKIKNNQKFFEQENLKTEHRFNEYLLKRLRTSNGIKYSDLQHLFGDRLLEYFKDRVSGIAPHLYRPDNQHLTLNLSGWFISDYIISELMI
jgi:oxygen-independent coproporphyrinogen III oxidase